MAIRVTLVRHGETDWNVQGRWQGHAPVPLNNQGMTQAKILAEALKPKAADIHAIYASDLQRAQQTARILAGILDKPLITDSRLREIDLGEWQGLTSHEVREWDYERYKKVQLDTFRNARPSGESWYDVGKRGAEIVKFIVSQFPEGHILAVTHGGVVRNTVIYLGLGTETSLGNVENTSLTTVAFTTPDTWELERYNNYDHLNAVNSGYREG